MRESLRRRVGRLRGKEPLAWTRVERGYTPAERWRVSFADGSSAFVKLGTTPDTARWLRDEHAMYRQLHGSFVPELLGFDDDAEEPLLVLEDLSTAHWPPPWRPGDVERVLAAQSELAATRPLPRGLRALESERKMLAGWLEVERDPAPFLALGLCSREWLAEALPVLLQAQDLAELDGDDLLHGDLRSDNVCLLGERVVMVDWNLARRGNAAFGIAMLLPSLRLEAGPLPDEVMPDEGPLAALVTGYFAARAGLPPIPSAPRVRWIQLRQLRIALPWTARALGLPEPDMTWGRDGVERVDAALAAGTIDEAEWHRAIEEIIGDAFLAASDPRAQSGKSGDEAEWRWSRELLLDAVPSGVRALSLLDVGCANGYLLESLARWGSERGLSLELSGLDISWRLVELARRRLPELAERIWVGNALEWRPTRRFDLVHSALDYVPRARQRESLEHLFRHVVAPGGRVVLRAERVRPGAPDLIEQVRGLGLTIGGVLEARHPVSGELRRTLWITGSP
jgi:methyltransferase family protein